jgi:hypothetical protein
VLLTCLLGLLAIEVAAGVLYAVYLGAVGPSAAAAVAIGFPVQWYGTYLIARRVSRRYGTGSVVRDLRWRASRHDVWPGLGTALLALVLAGLAAGLVRSALDLQTDTTSQFGSLTDDPVARVVIALAAIIGAPIFEELLFRGLVLRAMLGWGRPAALIGSSLAFAVVHLNPELTLDQNLVIAATIFVTGACLAWVVLRTGRLGPSMVAHLCFNLPAAALLLTGTG